MESTKKVILVFLVNITHFAFAESGISLTQVNTTEDINGVEYTVEQKVTLTIDELIEVTFTRQMTGGDVYILAPEGDGGESPVSISHSSKYFYVRDASLFGDISVRNGITTDKSLLVRFLTEDQWPSETDNPQGWTPLSNSVTLIESTNGAEYASESWTNGNPNTIWYKGESVTTRHNRLYLSYIGETYAAWIQLGFVIQPSIELEYLLLPNYSMLFSVEDHEIVTAENRQSMRLPEVPQISDVEMQIDIKVGETMTVDGTAHKQGTYVVKSSADLENWNSISTFNLNHPGSIEFNVSLPTQNTYEVWEIPSEGNTSHPNYNEESDVIWLDEPILESTPIRSRYFKIDYQAPE
jgi:hypothetical protein